MKRRKDAGHVLPLVAVCLAVLMGFGGLGVDVGYWEYNQREQQSAADAAAIGGAQQLIYSGCPNAAAATTAAQKDSSDNGFTDNGGTVKVVVQNPPSSGPFSGNNCAVQAQVNTTQVATFFTRLFGFTPGIAESTQATATVVANNPACLILLNPSQNTNFNTATVTAPKCNMEINGSANFHSATVDAASIGEGNYSGSNNGGTFGGASPTAMVPVSDPCPEIASCANMTNSPPSTSPCNGTYGGAGVLYPGCYNNLNLNKATVTLQANGTNNNVFVFAGTSNFNQATVVGNGVTIYIPSGAVPTNWNKMNGLALSPPTTGPYAGISYFQTSGNTATVNFNNNGGTSVSGLIYAPSAPLNYNGSTTGYTLIIAGYANFNGSESFGNPTPGQTFIKNVVLAQ